jgi:hypothetical protein
MLLCALATTAIAKAQSISEFHKPGDILRLEVVFDGADVDNIQQTYLQFNISAAPRPEQRGFNTGFSSGPGEKVKPGVYDFSFKIPENVADGDYTLQVNVTSMQSIRRLIDLPERFKDLKFTIRNPAHFSVGVKDIHVLPRGKD